ncbi:hypothetical protein NKH77_51935 [Streptomyces sp. M19]
MSVPMSSKAPMGRTGLGPDCTGRTARLRDPAHVEAPVLVLRAGALVPSLFATSVAELQRDATVSAATLVEEARLAGAFASGRFGGNVVVLPRRLLPFALSRDVERDLADPEAACAELASYGAPTVDNYRIFLGNVAAETAEAGVGELLYAVTVTMPDQLAELVRAHPGSLGTPWCATRGAGVARGRRHAAGGPATDAAATAGGSVRGRMPVGTAIERYAAAYAAFGQGCGPGCTRCTTRSGARKGRRSSRSRVRLWNSPRQRTGWRWRPNSPHGSVGCWCLPCIRRDLPTPPKRYAYFTSPSPGCRRAPSSGSRSPPISPPPSGSVTTATVSSAGSAPAIYWLARPPRWTAAPTARSGPGADQLRAVAE